MQSTQDFLSRGLTTANNFLLSDDDSLLDSDLFSSHPNPSFQYSQMKSFPPLSPAVFETSPLNFLSNRHLVPQPPSTQPQPQPQPQQQSIKPNPTNFVSHFPPVISVSSSPPLSPSPSLSPPSPAPINISNDTTGQTADGKKAGKKRKNPAEGKGATQPPTGRPRTGERQKKRLARKAELARESRRRKKFYIQDLENKVKQLTRKNEEYQRMYTNVTAIETSKEKEREAAQQRIRQRLSELVQKPDMDEDIRAELSHLVKQFVVNSRERQSGVEYHMERVQNSLVLGPQLKFALWGLSQLDDFYEQPEGLWKSVMGKHVGVSPSQLEALKSKRPVIRKERKKFSEMEGNLKRLRTQISEQLTSINKELDEIQKILTPLQLAKFHMWVENNGWCIQMLNTIFEESSGNSGFDSPAANTNTNTNTNTNNNNNNASSPNSANNHHNNAGESEYSAQNHSPT